MKKKNKPRDLWVYYSWHASGVGPHRNKKKQLPRKMKHKSPLNKDFLIVKLVYLTGRI